MLSRRQDQEPFSGAIKQCFTFNRPRAYSAQSAMLIPKHEKAFADFGTKTSLHIYCALMLSISRYRDSLLLYAVSVKQIGSIKSPAGADCTLDSFKSILGDQNQATMPFNSFSATRDRAHINCRSPPSPHPENAETPHTATDVGEGPCLDVTWIYQKVKLLWADRDYAFRTINSCILK